MQQTFIKFLPWLLTTEHKQQWFLATKNMPVVYTLLTCLMQPLVISFSFWEWNCSFEFIISRMFLKFRKNHWLSYKEFQNVSHKGASCIGRKAGHVTYVWKRDYFAGNNNQQWEQTHTTLLPQCRNFWMCPDKLWLILFKTHKDIILYYLFTTYDVCWYCLKQRYKSL
jgi:hypothetical protein